MTRSVRFRVTAVAAVASLVVLVVAGSALVFLQGAWLTESIDETLRLRATEVERLLERDENTTVLPSTPSEGFAQVMTPDHEVIASTPNLAGHDPLDLPTVAGSDMLSTREVSSVDDDTFRVLSRLLDDGTTILVGATYDVVDEASAALVESLALLIPMVVVVLGALTWWLVGRTLRPVDDIRAEVAEIGAADLTRRVPEPGSGDEVDRLAATMNQMLQRLSDAMTRESRFVADASHELRSPLTRLLARVELMMGDSGTDPDLQSIHAEILSMQATVEDLLFLARSEASVEVPGLTAVDLDDVVLGVCRHLDGADCNIAGLEAVLVNGNRSMLRRAVANLVENARRHAASRIDVRLSGDESEAVLIIRDDGEGVPVDMAEAIFDRFARVDAARSVDLGGTGLGLAIAREIAESHRGSLSLVNPGEQGAIFEMRLPLARES